MQVPFCLLFMAYKLYHYTINQLLFNISHLRNFASSRPMERNKIPVLVKHANAIRFIVKFFLRVNCFRYPRLIAKIRL
jgi:hypothetical protein